jgi:cytochrome c oxidase subunit 2
MNHVQDAAMETGDVSHRPVAGERLAPAGPVAETIADLWWLMLGLGVVVFFLFFALLLVGLVRSAGDADPATPGPAPPEPRRRTGRWILGGGVLMPVVVLLAVFGATVYAMRVLPTTAEPDALTVEIIGHRWWYEVHYPDGGGIRTRDEMHIPVGRQVELRLTSTDVIHSFWVPELGGKMDMLPDGTNSLVLQADEPGRWTARCAEFCGLHHAQMKLRVIAEPADRFDAWLAGQLAGQR